MRCRLSCRILPRCRLRAHNLLNYISWIILCDTSTVPCALRRHQSCLENQLKKLNDYDKPANRSEKKLPSLISLLFGKITLSSWNFWESIKKIWHWIFWWVSWTNISWQISVSYYFVFPKKILAGWPVGHSEWKSGWYVWILGDGDIRFLFCWVFGPVNRRENWKT